jgi:hypothetical protein
MAFLNINQQDDSDLTFKGQNDRVFKIYVINHSNWTVRSSRKINEFTRVSAPNALLPSSRLTIAETLSMQGF